MAKTIKVLVKSSEYADYVTELDERFKAVGTAYDSKGFTHVATMGNGGAAKRVQIWARSDMSQIDIYVGTKLFDTALTADARKYVEKVKSDRYGKSTGYAVERKIILRSDKNGNAVEKLVTFLERFTTLKSVDLSTLKKIEKKQVVEKTDTEEVVEKTESEEAAA